MMFMIGVRWWLFGCFFALFLPATAGEILGNILITKGLTKRKVTLPAYRGRGHSVTVNFAMPLRDRVGE